VALAADVRGREITRWTRPVVDGILGPEDAAELAELLADKTVVVQAVWRALRARGIGVSEAAVQKWAAQVRR
jgi:hypothetical protein